MKRQYRKKSRKNFKKSKNFKKWQNKRAYVSNKALYGKIDTALERRMKKIAEDEVKEQLVPLVYRQFINWNGTQDPSFVLGVDAGIGAPVNFEGQIFEMTQIPLRTTQSAQIQQQILASGFRGTDTIKVHGITIGIRCVWDQFTQPANQGYERNHLHIGVYKWRSPLNMVESSTNVPGPINENSVVVVDGVQSPQQRNILLFNHKPTAENLLDLYPWGYSQRLDNPSKVIPAMGAGAAVPITENEYMKTGAYQNKKKIFRTKLTNRYNAGNEEPNVQQFTKYIKLKNPMTIKYNLTQSNGARIQSPDKLFLVLRSHIKPAAGDTAPYRPIVSGFYKLHYYDV